MNLQKNIEKNFSGVFIDFIMYFFTVIGSVGSVWGIITTEGDSILNLIVVILLSILVVVFSFNSCVNFYKLIKKIPIVIIDEEGITNNFWGFKPYTIRWQEIDSIRIKTYRSVKYLSIESAEKVNCINELPWDNRIYLLLSKFFFKDYFLISMDEISYETAGTADEFYSYLQVCLDRNTKLKIMKCPKCNSDIQTENINIQTDMALCGNCQYIFKISENIENSLDDGFNVNDCPRGTWIKTDFNNTIIGATTRSSSAFFLVPFMLVWSGGSISGIYGSQIVRGEFDLVQSLLGIPFLIGSIVFWSFALMAIWGKVELTLNNQGGKIFTGIGNIGLNKSFLWSDISSLKEKQANFNYPGSQGGRIVFEGKKRISFGSGLKEARRYYLFRAIKSTMIKNRWK